MCQSYWFQISSYPLLFFFFLSENFKEFFSELEIIYKIIKRKAARQKSFFFFSFGGLYKRRTMQRRRGGCASCRPRRACINKRLFYYLYIYIQTDTHTYIYICVYVCYSRLCVCVCVRQSFPPNHLIIITTTQAAEKSANPILFVVCTTVYNMSIERIYIYIYIQ